jgi:two-component system, cell cycle sensor histidine kinase and response regulator CckA
MSTQFNLLLLYESENDIEYIIDEMKRTDLVPSWDRVDNEGAFQEILIRKDWDIIISDYKMPGLSAITAINHLKETKKKIPLIIFSKFYETDKIIEIMREGASDYILKGGYDRLIHSIERELKNSKIIIEIEKTNLESKMQMTQLRSIIEHIMDSIISVDVNFKITYVNHMVEKIFKYPANELINSHFGILFPENLREEQLKKIFLIDNENHHEIYNSVPKVMYGLCSDGQKFPIEVTISRTYSINEFNYTLVIRDISEKQKIESQILRSQRLESIGTLAGGIAHDLNNVLAPVLIGIQIFRDEITDERSLRMLSTMENSIKRGAEIIKQILTFSRGIEGEKIVVQPKHFLKDIILIASETFPKSIQINSFIPNDLWSVVGDLTLLHQIFLNLSLNSRDAMPEGGILDFKAENFEINEEFCKQHLDANPGLYVLVTIADTGQGIPLDLQKKIFEPFFSTKEAGKGSGLGLTTTLSIIRNHGGFIEVNSEEKKGSSFKVYIPAVRKDSKKVVKEEPIEIPSGHGEAILVVDDESAIREITKTTLESYGYEVFTANDGVEAIAIYQKEKDKIKVVITDIVMPLMDGNATIRSLLKIEPSIKIIVISGYAENEKILRELNRPDIIYLAKPYTAIDLLKSLNKVIK